MVVHPVKSLLTETQRRKLKSIDNRAHEIADEELHEIADEELHLPIVKIY